MIQIRVVKLILLIMYIMYIYQWFSTIELRLNFGLQIILKRSAKIN